MNSLNPNVQHNRAVGNHQRSQGSKNKDELKLQHQLESARVRNTSTVPSTGGVRPSGGMSPAAVFTLALLTSTVFPVTSGAPLPSTSRNENTNNTRGSDHTGTTSNTTSSSTPIPSPAATPPQLLNPMKNVTAPHAPAPAPMPTPSAEGVKINFAPHSSVRSRRSTDSTPKFDRAKTKCDTKQNTKCDSKQKVHCAEKMLKLTQNKNPNVANKAKEYLGTHADTLSSVLTKSIEKKERRGNQDRVAELKAIKGLVNEQKTGATASCYSMNAETGNNNKYLPLDKCISANMGTVNDGQEDEDNTCTWSNKCKDTIKVEFNGTQVDVQTRGTDSAASATNTVPCLQTGTTGEGKKKFIKPKCDSDGTTKPKVTKNP